MDNSPHIPVLLEHVTHYAQVKPGMNTIDATVGFGGHASALLEAAQPGGQLLGIDKDPEAVRYSTNRLSRFGQSATIVEGTLGKLSDIAKTHGFEQVDCILFDLGVSSPQLDQPNYGISFASSGALDMRIGEVSEYSAADIVNHWTKDDLKHLFTEHGQEGTNRLVDRIVTERSKAPIQTIEQIMHIIEESVPRFGKLHKATKVFQALRVAANDEIGELTRGLAQAVPLLKKGGRLLVISFHSLEDRAVKQFMAREAKDCICPSDYPECRCGHRAQIMALTKKPIGPNDEEIHQNPRSHSARLRVAEKK